MQRGWGGRGRGRDSPQTSHQTPPPGGRGGRRGTPSSSSGGGRGGRGRGRFSPFGGPSPGGGRLPGGGGSSGSRAAFQDKAKIFGGGQSAVKYEKEKGLWKVGPPEGVRFQLRAFLRGLDRFLDAQLDQRGGQDAAASPLPPPPPPPLAQPLSADEQDVESSAGEASSTVFFSGVEREEGGDACFDDTDTATSSAVAGGGLFSHDKAKGDASHSRRWWPSPSSSISLPTNAVATAEEAAAAATAARSGSGGPPATGPLQLSLRLERLDLTDVEAGMVADWAAGAASRGAAVVRKLWLFGNRLGDDGAAAVAAIIASGGVTEVHLSHNLIGTEGAVSLLNAVPVSDDGLQAPLWLRLEWNRVSLTALVAALEAAHEKRGLLVDVPEAVRPDAAPPLPQLPSYLAAAKAAQQSANDAEASPQRSSTPGGLSRGTRNQLRFIISDCHCRLPWVSSQFERPSEAAVLLGAKRLWAGTTTAEAGAEPSSSSSGISPPPGLALPPHASAISTTASASTGPLLLIPDTSALLAMAGADPAVTAPTFFTLEFLLDLATRGLFGRSLPPTEQTFLVVPATVATQLDALKADPRARSAVRRFMGRGLDEAGPGGANFLSMLGAHEGEGLILERGAEVAGSRGGDVGSKGQAADHRIVEVGLFFQQECLAAAAGQQQGTTDAVGRDRCPVMLLTSDNGQAQLARAHGLPAVRMGDLAARRAAVTAGPGRPLTASALREALRDVAMEGLGTVAARSLQSEFDSAVACLRAASDALGAALDREDRLRALLSGEKGDLEETISKATAILQESGEISQGTEDPRRLVEALAARLEEWEERVVRSHQAAHRVLSWSNSGKVSLSGEGEA